MIQAKAKIFQIGFNRCATMSLAKFFRDNGYRAAHWQGGRLAAAIELARRERRPLLHHAGDYDIYTDMELRELAALRNKWFKRAVFRKLFKVLDPEQEPAPIFAYRYFKEFDTQYPGSKFILNTRSMDRWVQSRLQFKDDYRACLHGDRAHASEAEMIACWESDWHTHHADVRSYFADRPSDLLEFNIETDPIDKVIGFVPMPLDVAHWTRHNQSSKPS